MASRVELVQVSASLYHIAAGRKNFGFIRTGGQGAKPWVGQYRFGAGQPIIATGDTPEQVFRALVEKRNEAFAQSAGFKSTAELDERNRQIRAQNRSKQNEVRRIVQTGDFDALLNLLVPPAKKD